MVGGAIVRQLEARGFRNIITRTHQQLDLTDQSQVSAFFAENKVSQVYLAAAKVGGIFANNEYPAEFIYENLMMEANVVHQAYKNGVTRLLFLGSSCIYPRMAEQPMREDALLTGKLEATNEPYAVAKIAGIKLCESYNRQYGVDYRSVMPTNLYGPGDNYHPENSHVMPAMIRRFHEAKIAEMPEVVVWGTGTPKREFLHVNDMADASIYVMNLASEIYKAHTQPMSSHLNIGCGADISISALAELVCRVVGFEGKIVYDNTKPDGTPRKLMDVSRLQNMGWKSKIDLEEGIQGSYADFISRLIDA